MFPVRHTKKRQLSNLSLKCGMNLETGGLIYLKISEIRSLFSKLYKIIDWKLNTPQRNGHLNKKICIKNIKFNTPL